MKVDPKTTKIGFVGTGIMGASMAGHLQNAGYSLYVHNRTRNKAEHLLKGGAVWCDSPGVVASEVEILFSIVGFPQDVREIYLSDGGIVAKAKKRAIICDMTTSEPSLASEIADRAREKGVTSIDAPVSGGDTGARNGTLSIMAGGDQEGFASLQPLFALMGKTINYMGPAGAGQHTKMCNQIVIAGTMMGMIEALRYAKRAGLCQQQLLKAICGGAAGSWSLDNLAPRIVQGNFDPGFLIKHFIKDMKVAQREADALPVNTPALDLALEYYQKAEQAGGGELGTHGLYKLWQEHPEW